MALIKCPECNSEVSSSAHMCPSCGFGVAEWMRHAEARRRFQEAEAKKKELKPKRDLYIGIISVACAACCCWPMMLNDAAKRPNQQSVNSPPPSSIPPQQPVTSGPPYSVKIMGVLASEINGEHKPKRGNVFLTVQYEVQKNISTELDDPMIRAVLKTKKKEWPNRNQTGAATYIPRMSAHDTVLNSWITFEVPKKEIKSPFKVVLDGQETEIDPSSIQE